MLLLVGCGKEVVDSKYTGKWKLESSGIGMSDGSSYKETNELDKVSLDLDIDAEGNVTELYIDDTDATTNSYKLKQKGEDEYRTELKDEEDNFVISFEIQSGKLIFKKLDKKENVLIKQTYTKQ